MDFRLSPGVRARSLLDFDLALPLPTVPGLGDQGPDGDQGWMSGEGAGLAAQQVVGKELLLMRDEAGGPAPKLTEIRAAAMHVASVVLQSFLTGV